MLLKAGGLAWHRCHGLESEPFWREFPGKKVRLKFFSKSSCDVCDGNVVVPSLPRSNRDPSGVTALAFEVATVRILSNHSLVVAQVSRVEMTNHFEDLLP